MIMEYDSSLFIYLTPKRGVQYLTDRITTLVHNSVSRKECSAREISEYYDIPLTTVHAALKRLIKTGIIREFTDPEDARRKLYSLTGVPIMMDSNEGNKRPATMKDVFSSIEHPRRDLFCDCLTLFAETFNGLGMGIDKFFLEAGRSLGLAYLHDNPDQSLEHKLGLLYRFFKKDELEVSYRSSLTVSLSDTERNPGLRFHILMTVFGFLMEVLPENTGWTYSNITEIWSAQDRLTLSAHFYSRYETENDYPDLNRRGPEFYDHDWSLQTYCIDGQAFAIANRQMNEVFNSLRESPKSAQELTETLGYPRITVYSAINRLKKIDAITAVGDMNRKEQVYRPNGTLFIKINPQESRETLQLTVPQMETLDDLELSKFLFTYFYRLCSRIGIEFDKLHEKVFEVFYNSISEVYDIETFEDFIDALSKFLGPDCEFERIQDPGYAFSVKIRRDLYSRIGSKKHLEIILELAHYKILGEHCRIPIQVIGSASPDP